LGAAGQHGDAGILSREINPLPRYDAEKFERVMSSG